MSKTKALLFISSFIFLSLAACSGGAGKDNGRGDTLTSIDTVAMLRAAETMYHGDLRPDSAVLELFMRMPELRQRGVPDHLSVIGIIPEDRVTIYNIATPEDVFESKRRFLEAEWAIDSTEYLNNSELHDSPDNPQCHIRITYEILPASLHPVDTLYYHSGIEF